MIFEDETPQTMTISTRRRICVGIGTYVEPDRVTTDCDLDSDSRSLKMTGAILG